MDWLEEAFLEPTMIQAVILLSMVSAIGLYLGKIKIFGISLGITFVFFAGILAGHLGIVVNKDMLYFAQSFGLIIFVYALGLQVGPGFFSSLKEGGMTMNLLGLGVIVLGLLLTLVLHWTTGIALSDMVGLLCGAVTNTPALGAAQQALLQIDPTNTKGVTDMALACAVTYPLGVVGVILAIILLRAIFARKHPVEQDEHRDMTTYIAEFQVCNPAIYGMSIKEIMRLTDRHFVISRVWRDGKVSIPTSDTKLQEHDHLLIISVKADVENIKVLFTGECRLEQGGHRLERHRQPTHLAPHRCDTQPRKRSEARFAAPSEPLWHQHHTGEPCGHRPTCLSEPAAPDWRPADHRGRG